MNYKEYFEILDAIGNGELGIVYKGKDKIKDELKAIKVINLDKIKENIINETEEDIDLNKSLELYINGFKKEFENMKICSENNNNSVKCYEYFNNEENFVIIMELCDKNLLQILNKRVKEEGKGFNIEEIYEIMKQLNNTFKIMKEKNIIHRDIKLENILIKYIDKEHKKYIIKLSDYGCSKRLISLSRNCSTYSGTLLYMSPEILKREEYNYKCDLWSIGIIIYKLYFSIFPYFGANENVIIKKIK